MRDRLYPGARRLIGDNFSSVVYLYKKNEWFCAAGFKGLSKKVSYAYKFPNEQTRINHVRQWQERMNNRIFTSKGNGVAR